MGLFSNNKVLCPICGGPTPRLFPTTVEGTPICKECKKKIYLPDGALDGMSMEDFRQYMNYYQENQALRDAFEETYLFEFHDWGQCIQMDTLKRLFRLGRSGDGLVMEASCIKDFRILEDDSVLFEYSPEGLKCYETDTVKRVEDMAPLIAQFRMEMQQYEHMRRMEEHMDQMMKERGEENTSRSSFSYMSRPDFDQKPLIKGFEAELTLEHPYWSGTYRWHFATPTFCSYDPSITGYLREYNADVEKLHVFASNLVCLMNPDLLGKEIQIGAPAGASGMAKAAGTAGVADAAGTAGAGTDAVDEIRRYKELMDSGIITEEEFAAKKRQLLGI